MSNINRVGRPSAYTKELADEICIEISRGNKGIKKLCKENENWPSPNTIYQWLAMYPEFEENYLRAKRFQIEVIIDEILDIADDTSKDVINDEGKITFDYEHINRSRLRIETRKWLASKLAPKIYGEKLKESEQDERRKNIEEITRRMAEAENVYKSTY